MSDTSLYIKQCRQWVDDFICCKNICPFASRVINENLLQYICLESADVETCLTEVFVILRKLQTSDNPETILVILPAWQDDFDGFLSLTEVARSLLDDYELSAEFQFASFHPEYLFHGETANSASHYTNRSPWPMLHILRQNSLSSALKHYPNPEAIPEHNIKTMQAIGKDLLALQLKQMQDNKHI